MPKMKTNTKQLRWRRDTTPPRKQTMRKKENNGRRTAANPECRFHNPPPGHATAGKGEIRQSSILVASERRRAFRVSVPERPLNNQRESFFTFRRCPRRGPPRSADSPSAPPQDLHRPTTTTYRTYHRDRTLCDTVPICVPPPNFRAATVRSPSGHHVVTQISSPHVRVHGL